MEKPQSKGGDEVTLPESQPPVVVPEEPVIVEAPPTEVPTPPSEAAAPTVAPLDLATELTNWSIDQTFITTPQTLNLTVSFSDNENFTDVMGYYYGTAGTYKDLNFNYDGSDGIFVAEIDIAQYERNQTFDLVVIYATRISDGQVVTFYNQEFSDWFFEGTAMNFIDAQFTYENPVTDVTPPEVEWYNITAEPVVVGGNQTVTITVPISDDSPIGDAYIVYEGEDKFSSYIADFQLNEKSGNYQAIIMIEPYAKSQFFSAMQLVVGDAYGNYNNFADVDAAEWVEGDRVELSPADFQISNFNEDLIPPVADLTTLRIELDADNRPVLFFNVSDDQSGVQFVSAIYQTTNGPLEASGMIVNGEAQIYLPIDDYMRTQTLTLQNLILVDYQNNRADYERADGLSAGDYEYTESDTLLVLALIDMMYFDKNQNGSFDSDELPTVLYSGGLYLENSEDPNERYYFVNEGSVGDDNFTFSYTGNTLLVNVPSGRYVLNLEPYGTLNQTITPGLVEISGDFGSQNVTIVERLGIYQDGTRLEIANGQIFSDVNGNGVFDDGDEYRLPVYEDDDQMKTKAMGMASYPDLFLEGPDGVRYGFAAMGKPGTGGNVYAYDLETGLPAFLPYGTYIVITTNPEEQITTPNLVTIDASNEHLLTVVLASIGIGPKTAVPVNQAPVFTGVGAKTLVVGSSFDPRSGVVATDPEDGVIEFKVTGTVDTSTIGTYTLTYTATDSEGLGTSVERVITIVAQPVTAAPTTPTTTTGTPTVTTTGTPTTLTNTGDQILAMTLLAGLSSAITGVLVIRRRK